MVGELCNEPSHWNKSRSLHQWLSEQGIPGIEGIDTRELTKRIRQNGTMLGRIVMVNDGITVDDAIRDAEKEAMIDPSKFNLVQQVSTKVSAIS